ncbi:DUF397 domain-containing protein [Streptomyces stramineus]
MTELHWQKSSYCEAGSTCIHLASAPAREIHLRESATPYATVITTVTRLHRLLARIKGGDLDH